MSGKRKASEDAGTPAGKKANNSWTNAFADQLERTLKNKWLEDEHRYKAIEDIQAFLNPEEDYSVDWSQPDVCHKALKCLEMAFNAKHEEEALELLHTFPHEVKRLRWQDDYKPLNIDTKRFLEYAHDLDAVADLWVASAIDFDEVDFSQIDVREAAVEYVTKAIKETPSKDYVATLLKDVFLPTFPQHVLETKFTFKITKMHRTRGVTFEYGIFALACLYSDDDTIPTMICNSKVNMLDQAITYKWPGKGKKTETFATPLMLACALKNTDVVNSLYEFYNTRELVVTASNNSDDFTVLPLPAAVDGSPAVVSAAARMQRGMNAIMIAAKCNFVAGLKIICENIHEDVGQQESESIINESNLYAKYENTALMYAVMHFGEGAASYLLQNGADWKLRPAGNGRHCAATLAIEKIYAAIGNKHEIKKSSGGESFLPSRAIDFLTSHAIMHMLLQFLAYARNGDPFNDAHNLQNVNRLAWIACVVPQKGGKSVQLKNMLDRTFPNILEEWQAEKKEGENGKFWLARQLKLVPLGLQAVVIDAGGETDASFVDRCQVYKGRSRVVCK